MMYIVPLNKSTYFDEERRSILQEHDTTLLSLQPADTITNNHVIDTCLFGRYQWFLAIACSLARMAAFSHIFLGTAVVSNQNVYWFLSILEDRMVYTVLGIFCTVGCVMGGRWSDIYGRKQVLMPGIILAAVAMIISAVTPHYYLFLVSNIIAGVAIGSNLTVSTALYMEFLPTKSRSFGAFVLNSLTYCGNFVICLVIYFLLSKAGWRWHYAMVALPNVIGFIVCFLVVDESPRFLGVVGQTELQLHVLGHIRSRNKASVDYSCVEEQLRSTVTIERGTWKGLIMGFFTPLLALSIIVCCSYVFTTMITFSLPIMFQADYCHLARSIIGDRFGWTSDRFEYVILSVVYMCCMVGGGAAHLLCTRVTRKQSFYIVFVVLVLSFIPQMKCFSTMLLLFGAGLSSLCIGAVLHIVTISTAERFPTFVRGAVFGVVYGGANIGALFGPYADLFIAAGGLKSVFILFIVLVIFQVVLVIKGVMNTEKLGLFENKDDLHTIDRLNYTKDESG